MARELAAWRERTAIAEDRPVGSVLADPPLRRARQAPAVEPPRRSSRSAASIHPRSGAAGAAILDAIARRPAGARRSRASQRAGARSPSDAPLIALAEALLRARALEAGLAYELIASRSELEQIVGAARRGEPEPDVRTLAGWRRELVGADLRDLLAGRARSRSDPSGG